MCELLVQSRYVKRSGRNLNPRPIFCKSDALTTTPRRRIETSRTQSEYVSYGTGGVIKTS